MRYFIPRYDHWYSSMIVYKAGYRYAMTFLVLGAVIGLWYLLLYKPMQSLIIDYQRMNGQLREKSFTRQQSLEASDTMAKIIKALEVDLRGYQSIGSNELIMRIVQQAKESHLRLDTCTVEHMAEYQWYRLLPITVNVYGSLDGIIAWLKSLTLKTKLLSLSQAAITSVDNATVRCSVVLSSITLSEV